MDFKDRPYERATFGAQTNNISSGMQSTRSAAKEREDNGKITKQIINQQLGLAPTNTHFKITFQPNQQNNQVSSELIRLQNQNTFSKPPSQPQGNSDNVFYSIPNSSQTQRSTSEESTNVIRLPPKVSVKNISHVQQPTKENIYPVKNYFTATVKEETIKLKNVFEPIQNNPTSFEGPTSVVYSHNNYQTAKFTTQTVVNQLTTHTARNSNAITENRKVKVFIPEDDNEESSVCSEPKQIPNDLDEDFYAYGDELNDPYTGKAGSKSKAQKKQNGEQLKQNMQNQGLKKPNAYPQNQIISQPYIPSDTLYRAKEELTKSDSANMFQRKKQENFSYPEGPRLDQNTKQSIDHNREKLKSTGDTNKAFVSEGGFKKYTYRDYKEIQESIANQKFGGLGANLGTEEWVKGREKMEKMQQFAKSASNYNANKMPNEKVAPKPRKTQAEEEKEKAKAAREKALEFAKNIPKPKTKKSDDSDSDREDDRLTKIKEKVDAHEMRIDSFQHLKPKNPVLAELELQHQQLQAQIRRIKSG